MTTSLLQACIAISVCRGGILLFPKLSAHSEAITMWCTHLRGIPIVSRLVQPGHKQITRRDFIAVAGIATLLSSVANAQQKVRRIGFLSPTSGLTAQDMAFLEGLEELGLSDGKTIAIHYRFAAGQFDRLPKLATELVDQDVELIVARVTQASLAAKATTRSIPIIMLAVSDPVGSGLVESLARPGENVTGTASMNTEVVGKSLEILKEIVPNASRVAVLWNPDNAVFQQQMLDKAVEAALALGLAHDAFGIVGPDEIGDAFTNLMAAKSDMLLVLGDPILNRYQTEIVEQAKEHRVPAVYANKEAVYAGGLISYGPNIEAQFRRAAIYVEKVLEGTKPADLPVEQPVEFELVVNLATAASLGLDLPLSVLARADEVIE